jgi:hypothetical protein
MTANDRPVGPMRLPRTTGIGASRPLPSVPTKVRLLNRLPTLDLGGGDYSSCPIAVARCGQPASSLRFGLRSLSFAAGSLTGEAFFRFCVEP